MDHSHHHVMTAEPPMHHGHEGHDMPDMAMCSMNMIFNWQIKDVCVVFESWHIHDWVGMLLSCVAVFMIAAGYEYLRVWTTSLDRDVNLADIKRQLDSGPNHGLGNGSENDTLLSSSSPSATDVSKLRKKQQVLRSVMYAILMGISFWLMLVFMTYNGYLMIATILGAGFGHYIFGQGRSPAARSISCH